jgi:hypothetical protein
MPVAQPSIAPAGAPTAPPSSTSAAAPTLTTSSSASAPTAPAPAPASAAASAPSNAQFLEELRAIRAEINARKHHMDSLTAALDSLKHVSKPE